MKGFRTALMPCLVAATVPAVLARPASGGLIESNSYVVNGPNPVWNLPRVLNSHIRRAFVLPPGQKERGEAV